MNNKFDIVVVGGGVLGSFHAYHAAKKGYKVAVIEKNSKPQGATVRNFGQVVPSGMNTKWQAYGRESLAIYKSIQSVLDITVKQEGSVYLASNDEEMQLLEELAVINKGNDYESHILTKEACLQKYNGLQENYVVGGLFFPEELKVEPRTMINKLHLYMETLGVTFFYNTEIINCEEQNAGVILTSAGNTINLEASKVIICNGSDFKTLYPDVFNESDLVVSKLQMMATKPQPNFVLPSSILTGLSIRRYEAFEECPSYSDIKKREGEDAFYKKWGIHILFKQATDGSIILGDSHEYATAAQIDTLGFDLREDIDQYIIQEAKKIFALPTYDIQHRWFGMYSQCKTTDIYQHTIGDNIHIITGIGGKGMTGSAGFAKEHCNKIL